MSRGMDERKHAAVIKVNATLRKKALKEFRSQLDQWELTMPSFEPLVSDFGLGDFYRSGLIECWIVNEIDAGYCAKFLFVFKGQTCPLHWHESKHETFFLIRGKIHISIDGKTEEMAAGQCMAVPAETPHSFTGEEPSLLLEVSQPCRVQDNIFHNPHIPIGPNYHRVGHLMNHPKLQQ